MEPKIISEEIVLKNTKTRLRDKITKKPPTKWMAKPIIGHFEHVFFGHAV